MSRSRSADANAKPNDSKAPRAKRLLLYALAMLLLAIAAIAIAWSALAPPGLGVQAGWTALTERTPSHWIRYAMRRLEGHPKLESIAVPILLAAQRKFERPVPADLLDLGKGQRAMGLTAQTYTEAGAPQPATALTQSTRPPMTDVTVDRIESLYQALQQAQAGQVIEVAPGTYRWNQSVFTRAGGTPIAPITLRARTPGSVKFDVTAIQALVIQHPYWIVENLNWQGVCKSHQDCEHAIHVVGAAMNTVVRNNVMVDFNAHVKVNGERGLWPDRGLLQFNTLTNLSPRRVDRRPITPVDLVGASAWVLRDNLVSNFVSTDFQSPSYGMFMKGGGENGLIEHNLLICSTSDISKPGARVGISLGGGLTYPAVARPGPSFTFEHRRGLVRNNIVAHCNEAGLDSNRAVNNTYADNVLINTGGILIRDASTAHLARNRLDGRLQVRSGAKVEIEDNLIGDTRDWYVDPDRLDMRPTVH